MRLIALKINARHMRGWESRELVFGNQVTSLFARNGSGKTPLIQSIAFCLGMDFTFREDIRNNCASATLTIEVNDETVIIERTFEGKEFIVQAGGGSRRFQSEAEFSASMFQIFGLKLPSLISASKKSTSPYISTVLPIFFLRQDGGYLGAYSPARSFIQDQFVEMLRFIFGFPPKRAYSVQKDLLDQKGKLDLAQRRVTFQQELIARLAAEVDDSRDGIAALKHGSEMLTTQIEELRNSVDQKGTANNALVELLGLKEDQLRKLRRSRSELQARIDGIDSIRSEIEGEIKTLSLNEESRQIFASFDDICANVECGIFRNSREEYGKNLLYLKDQIKDLEANVQRAESQISYLDETIEAQARERSVLRERMSMLSEDDGIAQVIVAIQGLTRELMGIEQKLLAAEKLAEEKRKYLRLDEERFKIQDAIAAMTRGGRSDLGFNQLREQLEKLTAKWMDILATANVSRNVTIEPDFTYRFGTEYLDVFTGSGKARLVLAIHGAIFEKYLEVEDRPFRFMVLDTPKQHELETPDLIRYLNALQVLCSTKNAQIVVSSTEYRHPVGAEDQEWLPDYLFPEKPMYLGSPQS